MTIAAPLLSHLDGVPPGGHGFWVTAPDGVRLRAAVWRGGARGTFLILPGRTEYIEKYAHTVRNLLARGFSCLVIDWRGQGLSDRNGRDAVQGHVESFAEYQHDLHAILAAPQVTALPGPRWMLAHSMGGCIGLRALIDGLSVESAIFSAPMWGISMTPGAKVLSGMMTSLAPKLGRGTSYTPGQNEYAYVSFAPFEDNVLTADREIWDWLKAHLTAHPELALGGPSLSWLGAALREMAALARAKQPEIPILTLLGSEENVVSSSAIWFLSRRQTQARVEQFDGGRHELLMEGGELGSQVWQTIDEFCSTGSGRAQSGT